MKTPYNKKDALPFRSFNWGNGWVYIAGENPAHKPIKWRHIPTPSIGGFTSFGGQAPVVPVVFQ